jgi:hypothetical protein
MRTFYALIGYACAIYHLTYHNKNAKYISIKSETARVYVRNLNDATTRESGDRLLTALSHREEMIVQRGNTRQIMARRYIQSINYRKLY